MPITYVCNAAVRITIWTVSDPVMPADWLEVLARAENDPEMQQIRPLGSIIDIRGRTEFPLKPTVQALSRQVRVRLLRRNLKRFPVAVVVTTQVAHGMARMAAGYIGDVVEAEIFLELAGAQQWVLTRASLYHASGEQ